jgi:hypothetical protein
MDVSNLSRGRYLALRLGCEGTPALVCEASKSLQIALSRQWISYPVDAYRAHAGRAITSCGNNGSPASRMPALHAEVARPEEYYTLLPLCQKS